MVAYTGVGHMLWIDAGAHVDTTEGNTRLKAIILYCTSHFPINRSGMAFSV